MLKLYYTPNTCARASHIALEEVGAAYETVRINFATVDQRRPEFIAINPKGRVPVLVTDKGILTETPAILTFIAQSFPQARLAPLDDYFAFAKAQAFNAYICSTVHVAHAHGPRGSRWADDPAAIADMKRKVPQTMSECFGLVENTMFEGPWVLGEVYSICDIYLFTVMQWLEGDGVDPAGLPKLSEHRQRMMQRGAVARALAAEEAAG